MVRFTLQVSGGKLGGFNCGLKGVLLPLGRAMLLKASVPVTAQHKRSANGKRWQARGHKRSDALGHDQVEIAGKGRGEATIGGAQWGSTSRRQGRQGLLEQIQGGDRAGEIVSRACARESGEDEGKRIFQPRGAARGEVART